MDFADIYQEYPLNAYQRLDYFARGRFANLLGRLTRHGIQRHHRILDVGCGNGVFVDYLRQKKFVNVQGFDPYVPGLDSVDKNVKYDCIIANDVIEHVEDPREFLRDWAHCLADNGLLYIGTSDSEFVNMGELNRHLMLLHLPFHRLLFTQKTLERLGSELPGFELIESHRRSYMDTALPFVNYRFLDEFNLALGNELDLAFAPVNPILFLKSPRLLAFAFLGYFFPSAAEPAIVLRKLRGDLN